ncbi:ABC transporter permease [Dyella amyloliquefaciens]|uniref:ABC transporter permease n=1 Tax=Dyella amyloliquefaciens TaxID=1770545 RepID=UPI00102EA3FE|nr:FtsX-like permease family protein [Dyella amyloliquefaciens]
MHFAPILAALRRHRLATLLIAMEIALACAVLCNACFLIAARMSLMHIDSGVDESSLALIKLDCDDCNSTDLNARMMAALRAVPGVQSVAVVNTVPFSDRAGDNGVSLDREHYVAVPHFYLGGPGSAETLGLRLAEGRPFQPEDFQAGEVWVMPDTPVWITRALADKLWPGEPALGKEFWVTDKFHFRVVGVLAHLARPDPGGYRGAGAAEWSVFAPMAPGKVLKGTYVLRAAPADLARVVRDARAAAQSAAPEAVLDLKQSRAVSDLRDDFFRPSRIMAGMLVGVIVALLLVTAMGIVGLASFWVQQRRKQIGIRRAIGATKHDILRYFQTENFLIVSGGIVIGMLLAIALNLALMKFYELPRLPMFYLPVGAVVLWLLGQAAVLGPALRAASVPPVVATRSV